MSLALSTLIYEWRRYLAAVIALAFSGVLVLAQVGMMMGIGKAFTATIDRSAAQLMVLPAKAESMMNTGGLPRRVMPAIHMHPEVTSVLDMDGDGAMWSNLASDKSKQKREFVQIMSVDTHRGAATLPVDYTEEWRLALAQPYSVAVDETALARLETELGGKATLNGRQVVVRAVTTGYPNMMQPTVVMSRQTLRLLGMASNSRRVGPLLVKIEDPERSEIVRDQLNAARGPNPVYRVWTKEELSAANEKAMMQEQFIGIVLGFSVFLGAAIGIGITWQTLRGAIMANIKEFASLRALGVSMGSLRWIVLELSFWVGVTGLLLTAVLVAGVTALGAAGGVPLAFPPDWVAMVAVLLVLIALGSGLLSLSVLKKSQPADLLR